MSTLVYTKVVQNATVSAFEQLCERCCWPTLKEHGERVMALLYPEEAIREYSWTPDSKYFPMHLRVAYQDGKVSCDGDFQSLKDAMEQIYQALSGNTSILPRPSKLFCQKFSLSRQQLVLRSKGLKSDLVEVDGEWCLDVEAPETEGSMEVSLS